MRHTRFPRALAVVVLLCSAAAQCFGQPVQIKIPLSITDRLGNSDTLPHFGIDSRATYCVDTALGEFPLPPDGCRFPGICLLCGFFADPRGYNADCFDEGMLLDFREYRYAAQQDTFLLNVSSCDTLYPLTIRWPSSIGLSFDSAQMIDQFGGFLYNVNMLTADSLIIADTARIYFLIIFTWGPKIPVNASEENELHPKHFLLSQNYPNPFNPSTKIKYTVKKNQYVRLTIYDVFGREIAKLVDGRKPPGEHEVEWNASDFSSGVYFYRIQTDGFVSGKKMMLVR